MYQVDGLTIWFRLGTTRACPSRLAYSPGGKPGIVANTAHEGTLPLPLVTRLVNNSLTLAAVIVLVRSTSELSHHLMEVTATSAGTVQTSALFGDSGICVMIPALTCPLLLTSIFTSSAALMLWKTSSLLFPTGLFFRKHCVFTPTDVDAQSYLTCPPGVSPVSLNVHSRLPKRSRTIFALVKVGAACAVPIPITEKTATAVSAMLECLVWFLSVCFMSVSFWPDTRPGRLVALWTN
ncbi:hypothetical protein EDC63_102153 [Sulfurirhabdus autotrophica]|uniref:Uncharacterized protein n=1 Tax=Sulfurirhabdus autotrophica TaxID=1706046 RepID=A0A4R3YGF2_9PROT|nr:hypothetical protein EDC63_102153 [Sulfurirhabdus autotrophica]